MNFRSRLLKYLRHCRWHFRRTVDDFIEKHIVASDMTEVEQQIRRIEEGVKR